MGRKKDSQMEAAVAGIAGRYPAAFSLEPFFVRPLKKGIVEDILADLRTAGLARDVGLAIAYYQRRFSYLNSVVFCLRARDLRGHRVEFVGESDRAEAKEELKRRGLWTPQMGSRYNRKGWIDE